MNEKIINGGYALMTILLVLFLLVRLVIPELNTPTSWITGLLFLSGTLFRWYLYRKNH